MSIRLTAPLLSLLLVLANTPATAGRPLLEAQTERPPAPAWSLSDEAGRLHRQADYRGRVLVVNFWASWCPPCRAEMPSMERAAAALAGEGVALVAIAMGEDHDRVRAFAAEQPTGFPLLSDPDSEIAEAFGVRGLPTTYVIDRQGRIAYRAEGGRQWDSPRLLEPLRRLAGE